jgi:predicted dehydrogenase
MIRVGLIGAGFIGRNHFNQYEKLAETGRAKVVALCDKEAERRAGDWSNIGGNLADAQGTQRDLGDIQPYADYRKMLAEADVDLVDICAPTFLHPEMAIAAMEAGKHVLCEKPMALTVEACDQMLEAAQRSQGKFMIAQCIRFWPEYIWLKQAVDKGCFGVMKALHLRRQTCTPDYTLSNWSCHPELSGGAVLDLHVHDVDYALWLLGRPNSVFAQGRVSANGSVDRIHATWDVDADVVMQLEGWWDAHPGFGFNMGFTAVFETATAVWDLKTGQPLNVHCQNTETLTPELPPTEAYYAQIAHFLDCIETGSDPSISTPTESRDAVAIALIEKQSALSRAPVAVTPGAHHSAV